MDRVSKSFMYEDLTDPVAISMFVQSESYEQMNDEYIAEQLIREEGIDDMDDYGEDLYDDWMYGSCNDSVDMEINDEEEVDMDISDEDGELIDIVDGII